MKTVSVKTHHGVTTISANLTINKSNKEVWNALKDVGGIEKFHPLVKQSHTIGETKSGLGARRYCRLLPMGQMV